MIDANQVRFSFGPPQPGTPKSARDEEADLFHYIGVVRRRKRLIAGGVMALLSCTIAVTYLMTPIYESRTSILPRAKERNSSMSALLGRVNSIVDIGGFGIPADGDSDKFINILESRTLAASVAEKLDLLPVLFESRRSGGGWKNPAAAPTLQDAVDLLREKVVSVVSNNRGLITVTVRWKNPEVAAAIADEYVEELGKYLKENDLTVASKHMSFVKDRLRAAAVELRDAEDAMKSFCEKNGIVSLPEQTQLLFEQISALYIKARMKETELEVLKKTVGSSNPEILRKQTEIDAILRQIREIEQGRSTAYVESNGYIPLYKLPEKSLEYARAAREVTIKQSVFSYLQTEYESARMAENREAISFVRLDEASRPRRPVKPDRPMIVGLAGVVSCLAMFMLASFVDYVERRKREEYARTRPTEAGQS